MKRILKRVRVRRLERGYRKVAKTEAKLEYCTEAMHLRSVFSSQTFAFLATFQKRLGLSRQVRRHWQREVVKGRAA